MPMSPSSRHRRFVSDMSQHITTIESQMVNPHMPQYSPAHSRGIEYNHLRTQ